MKTGQYYTGVCLLIARTGTEQPELESFRFLISKGRSITEVLLSGGAVASWLVRSTPERALPVRALAGDIVLCS